MHSADRPETQGVERTDLNTTITFRTAAVIGLLAGIGLASVGAAVGSEFIKGRGAFALLFVLFIVPTALRNETLPGQERSPRVVSTPSAHRRLIYKAYPQWIEDLAVACQLVLGMPRL